MVYFHTRFWAEADTDDKGKAEYHERGVTAKQLCHWECNIRVGTTILLLDRNAIRLHSYLYIKRT